MLVSRTQKSVTLSISEAKYVALGDAVKELLCFRYLAFYVAR